ncbi:Putative amidase domain-containing protein [Proteiniborus ethanoligenes]|uniref:Putative amidase domain-containing protein n=1 Tax=Proteiniborus ethanoligenes TaxID=415015 RepID=A0A1H3Q6H1_9FIRM|nr:amidase domain-containing protein [Proteiniborus ethanoligenes]SDZ09122.1 Putative amidase domain-containing protein [Proteiniborus ethanoligenes]
MAVRILLFRTIYRSLINRELTKAQIYDEILHRIKGKEINFYDIERLYKYIVRKKYNNATVVELYLENRDALNILDIEGYRDVLAQEEYITRLITQRYGRETSLSNWKMNLYFLKGAYSHIIKDKSADAALVNSYIQGYSFIESIKLQSKKKSKKSVNAISTYSPEKAVKYAITHAFNYNTDKYPSYAGKGGDCANFISQALNAGGKPMLGTNATNFKNWFCRSNNLWDVSKISSTWRGADAFSYYWMSKAVSYKDFDRTYFNDDSKFKKVLSYGHRGDAVSLFNSNGRPFHTLIIIDYAKDDLICAAHSNDTITASLKSYGYFGGVRIYKMSD